jgi:hypothetical protein
MNTLTETVLLPSPDKTTVGFAVSPFCPFAVEATFRLDEQVQETTDNPRSCLSIIHVDTMTSPRSKLVGFLLDFGNETIAWHCQHPFELGSVTPSTSRPSKPPAMGTPPSFTLEEYYRFASVSIDCHSARVLD